MYVGFPHMGNVYIGLTALFKTLDIPWVDIPPINKETIELGIRYTPESSCLPFKVVLANYIQALEKGADRLIMLGGCGPCRFGYFGNLQERILRDIGYEFQMVIVEPLYWRQSLYQLQTVLGIKSKKQLVYGGMLAWHKLMAVDRIEQLSHQYRGRSLEPGKITEIYQDGLRAIIQANDRQSIDQGVIKTKQQMRLSSLAPEPRLKIALVGDIYTLIEPYVNYRTEELLGERGIEVERSIYCARWVRENFLPWERKRKRQKMLGDARGYLNGFVGGHGMDTVANTIDYARKGFDGVVQLLPMTCMPEIVAQSILPKVSTDYNIPVMSLVLDEHSSATGLETRLEAFIDLIEQRKKAKGTTVVS